MVKSKTLHTLILILTVVLLSMVTACSQGNKTDTITLNTSDTTLFPDNTATPEATLIDSTATELPVVTEEPHIHSFSEGWVQDSSQHWHECTCGEKKDFAFHSFGDWIVLEEPTCITDGSNKHVCEKCGYEEIIAIEKKFHSIVIDTSVAATCTQTGKTEGSHCSVCGAVLKAQETIPATGHTVVKDNAVTATCTQTGKTEGSHCSVCNEVFKVQETVPAKGHTSVKDNAVTATCTQNGKTEGSHCSVCGAVLKAQETIPAKGHSVVKDNAVAATCTQNGKTEGSHCSVCNEVIEAQETIPAKGHTDSEWIIDVEATCSVSGKRHKICPTCGVVYDDENYYKDHIFHRKLTQEYWYYKNGAKQYFTQNFPFVANVCEECGYGSWEGPIPTLKLEYSSYDWDGFHMHISASAYEFKSGIRDDNLYYRFILCSHATGLVAAAKNDMSVHFSCDSGWTNNRYYEFDCRNNPYDNITDPYLFVVIYDASSGIKQTYGAYVHVGEYTMKTDGTWYYEYYDLSMGNNP